MTPSLVNFLWSIGFGVAVLAAIFVGVLVISNFDLVKRS